MSALQSNPNPYVYNYETLDQKQRELEAAAQALLEGASDEIQMQMFQALDLFQTGVKNQVLGFVNAGSANLMEMTSQINKNEPLYQVAQKVRRLMEEIRQEMAPSLAIFAEGSKKIIAEVNSLIAKKGLEDTPKNRNELLPEARKNVTLTTKDWFLIHAEDLNQAGASFERLIEIKTDELLKKYGLENTQETRAQLQPEAKKLAKATKEWAAVRELAANAITRIQETKKRMVAQIKEGKYIDPKAQQVCDAVYKRLEAVDADGCIRYELNTYTGWMLSGLREVGSGAKMVLPVVGVGAFLYYFGAIQGAALNAVRATVGEGGLNAAVMGLAGWRLRDAFRGRNIMNIALSTIFFGYQCMAAYQFMNAQQMA